MNVGPTARGAFDKRAQQALSVYADWMAFNSRSIYGCTMSPFQAPSDCRFTQNGKRLYLHVFAWPFRHLHLDDMADKVDYVQFLHDGSEIAFTANSETNCLTLQTVVKPDVTVPVINCSEITSRWRRSPSLMSCLPRRHHPATKSPTDAMRAGLGMLISFGTTVSRDSIPPTYRR